ncbi:MAG: Smr/MutS family protein [Deltaproteobacteria bacterium]|nr:Smr/MutS family protein [Deltaproteobacteria bacterium]MBW2340598.1 Smr/MutS family protein [Deltaproteobacteria bacterium]
MDDSPVEIPIDGVIDLHTFAPRDAADVVDEYLNVCSQKGILEVKIIHGKGKGVLRRTVESALQRHPLVLSFTQDSGPSSWGATIVFLRRSEHSPQGIPQPSIKSKILTFV